MLDTARAVPSSAVPPLACRPLLGSTPIDLPIAARAPALATAAAAPVTAMRAVVPIALDGAVPAAVDDREAPEWDLVAPGDLLVDDTYQRDLSPRSLALIRRIVAGWSWAKFKPPVCARVGGRLHVLDGQHTAIAAASHGGVPLIPVLIVPAPRVEDRAAAFVSHAVDRLAARPLQIHNAAVAAGDEDALTIRNVLDRAGVTMLAHSPEGRPWAPGETMALAAVRGLVDRRGAMRSREVMQITAGAGLAPIQAEHIRAAEALSFDPEYAGAFDAERITAALRDLTPKQATETKELAFAKRMPLWRALTAVLFRAHAAPAKRGRKAAASAGAAPGPATSALAAPQRRSGTDDVPTAELVAGIARWRDGGGWPAAWGPSPAEAGCTAPDALLGAVAVIVGVQRREITVLRMLTLWRRGEGWPKGWGPAPDDRGCAIPPRFKTAAGVE